jgi:hypothetical protein
MQQDLKSGAEVTLRSSEVREVSSDEVKKATGHSKEARHADGVAAPTAQRTRCPQPR